MIKLVTYSDSSMSISRQLCIESAKRNGVNDVYEWNREALEQTDFYDNHKDILDEPRGNGYWLWKPFIILDALQRSNEGDIIIYSDAGIEFVSNVNHIVSRMDQHPWIFGNMWQHIHWCKMDVILELSKTTIFDKQVQASVMFLRNNGYSKWFVQNWLTQCCRKNLIDDSPSTISNHEEFKDHRHDQAILTCLAYNNEIPLHWWPAMYNAGNFIYEKTGYPVSDNYPVMFHHHRRRNDEWNLTDDLNKHITNYFQSRYKLAI